MKKIIFVTLCVMLFVSFFEASAFAEKASPTVAVLSFEAKEPLKASMGGDIADLSTAYLTALYPGLKLVERGTLKKILEEQELNLSGIVEDEKATNLKRKWLHSQPVFSHYRAV